MMMHKRKSTNKSNRGMILGRYTAAHLAAYLINNAPTPDDPMLPLHRVALESVRIIGEELAPRKEKPSARGDKSPRRGSGSRRRFSRSPDKSPHRSGGPRRRSPAKDARDDITQSKIDKARHRRAARVGFESNNSEESQEYDGELRGADCLSHRIREVMLPRKFKPSPSDAAKYDGQQEPRAWIEDYLQTVILHKGNEVAAMQCL
jgi:hypothetical protein